MTIRPEIIQKMGVRTTTVKKGTMQKYIKTVGYVAYNEDKLIHVHPRSSKRRVRPTHCFFFRWKIMVRRTHSTLATLANKYHTFRNLFYIKLRSHSVKEKTQYGKGFQFEVVTVNREGEITHREQKQARSQTEDLGKDVMLEMVYIPRLSEKTGKTYRLPSEAEWEYACRAGTTTPFYFGETITTDLVNYNGKYPYASAPEGVGCERTTDVGRFPPNAFGLYDMHGNLWEWCADSWHDNYEGAPADGSVWKGNNEDRFVLRGGSWYDRAKWTRSSIRLRGLLAREKDNNNRGFRLARLL